MTNYNTFPKEAYEDDSIFIEYARHIGRAYRIRAMGLIEMCRRFSQVNPLFAHQDDDLRRVLRACDLAFRSAADSGKEVTDDANQHFNEATDMLRRYAQRWFPNPQGSPSFVDERMKMTKLQDEEIQTTRHYGHGNWWGPLEATNFILLQSPFAAVDDPGTVVVRQVLSSSPRLSEILWNFSRFDQNIRITLEQNPHFYASHPTDGRTYTSRFKYSAIKDSGDQWQQLRTIYVLVDRPGRVFLETKPIFRSFGNIWLMNDFLMFKDHRGSLEGEALSSLPRNLSYCEREIISPESVHARSDRRFLRPIMTTPFAPTAGRIFEDWPALSHLASHSIHIYIYDPESVTLPDSTESVDLPPPPPTSLRPAYNVLYTSVQSVDDDILLSIFNYYRLADESSWNLRLGWCKLSHVSRGWRNLIYQNAFHLDMHILCTNGTPVVDTLVHLPSLPLVIDYQDATAAISAKDELGMSQALQLHDRVRRVVLSISPAILPKLIRFMDGTFPILEHLCLSSTAKAADAGSVLPTTFMAPNLRHLTLLGVGFPKGLPFLTSTFALVTLTLAGIQTSGYFLPKHLVAHLRFIPQLAELSVCFSIPIPRPSAESELLSILETPVTLPALRRLTFRGVSPYLESLVAQIRAPILEKLDITTFNQVAFILPHLSDFTNTTNRLKLPIAHVIFDSDAVSVTTNERGYQRADGPSKFSFRVLCREFDWQVDCATQICDALRPALSGVEGLTLDFDGKRTPTEFEDGAVDGMMWRGLLFPFVGTRELHICHALAWDLSFALQSDNAGLDPMLLPGLQQLAPQLEGEQASNAFSSFLEARQIAGRPVRVPDSTAQPIPPEQDEPPNVKPDLASRPRPKLGNWFRSTVINRIRGRGGQKTATPSTTQ